MESWCLWWTGDRVAMLQEVTPFHFSHGSRNTGIKNSWWTTQRRIKL